MKQKNITAAIICAVLMMVCMGSLDTYAAGHVFKPGHKHSDVEIYKVPGDKSRKKIQAKSFPDKLDPRQEDWYKSNIKVRDQADTNLCWAFSVCSAAQISYARERYQETGQVEKVGLLSPVQLGYFFYNRENDPLGNTGGDKNNVSRGSNWIDEGNSCINTMQHLATWSGGSPEPEETGDTSFTTDYNQKGETIYTGKKIIDPMYAYADVLVEEETAYYKEGDAATLKNVISEYGAAVVSLFFGNDAYPLENYMQNNKDFFNNKYNRNNHEVVVVGWDDNYPKENFSCIDRKTRKAVQPENDGAWIVMNSWGEGEHDQGYFYVSYESEDILSDGILGLNMEAADDASSNYQYDGNANDGSIPFAEGEQAANVFTALSDVAIDSISFTEFNDGSVTYDLSIYTDLSDKSDPASGHLMGSQEFSTTTPGYKTIPLNKPVSVSKGKTFAVIIRVKKAGSQKVCFLGGELTESDNSYVAELTEGQSFYRDGEDEWTDAASPSNGGDQFCIRIKAQTSTHTWGAPEYQWSADNKEVTASRTCLDDPAYNETETVKTTAVVSKPATVTEMGDTSYTAVFVNPAFATQSKTLSDIPKTPKKAGTLTVKAKAKTVKFKTLQKKAVTVAPLTVKKKHGKVTYKVVSGNKKAKKALKLTAKGKITVKKKTKKGTYKIKVKVADAGNTEYKPSSKTVTVSIKVR